MTLLEAALDYAARGWPVFPIYEPDGLGWCACKNPECKSPAKHPRNRNGCTGAITDREQIERWWRAHPDASIGLATGDRSGLWVLDVDPKDGGDARLAELLAQHGQLPPTLQSVTGSGGRHIFFQHLPGLSISSGKNGGPLPAGLDTRGQGGYVVAPPSLHRSGGQYRWADGLAPGTQPASIPGWILELENQRQQEAILKAHKRVAAVERAGPRLADFKAAIAAYNTANARDFPRQLSACPICPSSDGFKAHGRVPGRWSCWSSKHTHGGTQKSNHWMGDVLDLDAAQHGRTRKEHLEVTGYWGHGVRAEQFSAARDERLARVAVAEVVVDEAGSVEVEHHPPPLKDLSKSFASLCEVLRHPSLALPVLGGRAIEFNEMSSRVELGRQPLQDHHVLEIRERIELAHCDRNGFGLTFGDGDIWKAAALLARRRCYHPVREYLLGLVWDGTERIAHMAEDFFGCSGTEIEQVLMRRWMVSCVARAMPARNPDDLVNKVDTALVLVGDQGLMKGWFFKRLAGARFFADTSMRLGDKDAYLQMRGKWVYEWPELGAMKSSRSIEDVKAFLTSQVDTFRTPYGRGTEDVPRSCVFVGSTDKPEFLNDPAGERRFWPITVCQEIDLDAVERTRDQLWAEAAELYRAGEQWHLTSAEKELLGEVHQRHRETDPWEEVIAEWLETADAANGPVTTARILECAVQKHKSIREKRDENRVAAVMKALGWAKDKHQSGPRGPDRVRRWRRAQRPDQGVEHENASLF